MCCDESSRAVSRRQGLLALSPMAVFLLSYVAVSVYIGDFYKMPVSVALAAASVWAVAVSYTHLTLPTKLEV